MQIGIHLPSNSCEQFPKERFNLQVLHASIRCLFFRDHREKEFKEKFEKSFNIYW